MDTLYKFLEKALKIFFGLVVVSVLGILVFYFKHNESLPLSSDPEFANETSQKMLKSMGGKAWNKTRYISWVTHNNRHYIWDKREGFVKVSWSGNHVIYNIKSEDAIVKIGETTLKNKEKKEKLVYLAKEYFEIDRFWFSAPYEVFDLQIDRTMVLLEGQSKRSLCVQYLDNHKSRAGEAYIYILDDKNRPLAWKMWNDNFYFDGLQSEWIDWQKTSTGFWYPLAHKSEFFGYNINIQNMLTGKRLKDIGLSKDPFKLMRK